MRLIAAMTAGAVVLSGVAYAQTAGRAPADEAHGGYVQAMADVAFGNTSSQSYGAEAGVRVRSNIQVFVEGGRVNNVASSEFVTAAQVIAGGLSQTQSPVGFSAREPVVFGDAGVRYLVPMAGSVQPYVMGGVGIARVKQDAKFTVGGADVTGNLAQYGIVLGSDLSGDFTKPLLVLGGGVSVPVWGAVVLDLHYRYGRIFAPGQGINVSRAGIGVGVSF